MSQLSLEQMPVTEKMGAAAAAASASAIEARQKCLEEKAAETNNESKAASASVSSDIVARALNDDYTSPKGPGRNAEFPLANWGAIGAAVWQMLCLCPGQGLRLKWSRFDQFWDVIHDFTISSPQSRALMLEANAIEVLLDFYLNDRWVGNGNHT